MTKQNYEELKNKIGTARVDELRHYWGNETEDEDTQEWREEITAADGKSVYQRIYLEIELSESAAEIIKRLKGKK